MINLIPPEGHKAVKREYRLRVMAVSLLFFGWVFFLFAIALIPTYILIQGQIKAFTSETEQKLKKDDILAEADQEVRMTKDILTQLKLSAVSVTASDAIAEVQKNAPAEIIFKTFSTEVNAGVIERIQVQGVAPTRDALSQLKGSIESSEMFEKAEVPISDLARDINLPFSITIVLTKTK